MDGILNVLKPQGMTSMAVVSQVKRIFGERHVGHGGTLDPKACGVLPILVGKATRLMPFLLQKSKAYRAEVELGMATDTYDVEGKIISMSNSEAVTYEEVGKALANFRGPIWQIPPMYSAARWEGKRLYELARKGLDVERRPKLVHIFHLEVEGFNQPWLTLVVECSSGTYIRSLVSDLGRVLGCGATLINLIRTRYGSFLVEDAVPLSKLVRDCFIYPPSSILDFDRVVVEREEEEAIRRGQCLMLEDRGSSYVQAYTQEGDLLAILSLDKERELWHPDKVFVN